MDDPLEQRLKRALEPQDPPRGFAERVLVRALAAGQAGKTKPPWWRLAWEWLFRGSPAWRVALAGGLTCVVLLGAGLAYRQRQARRRGEAARAELLTALQITSSELNRVREIVILVHDQPGQTSAGRPGAPGRSSAGFDRTPTARHQQ